MFALSTLYLAMLGAILVTVLIRLLPVLFLAHRKLPAKLSNILMFIPTAILSAISITEIIHNKATGMYNIPIAIPAAIISFVAGYLSRSLFVSILASVVAYFLLQNA